MAGTNAKLEREDGLNVEQGLDLKLSSELELSALFFSEPRPRVAEEPSMDSPEDVVGELEQLQRHILGKSIRPGFVDFVGGISQKRFLVAGTERGASSVNEDSVQENLRRAPEARDCRSRQALTGEPRRECERLSGISCRKSTIPSGSSKIERCSLGSNEGFEGFIKHQAPVSLSCTNKTGLSVQGRTLDLKLMRASKESDIIDELFAEMRGENPTLNVMLRVGASHEDTKDGQISRLQTVPSLKLLQSKGSSEIVAFSRVIQETEVQEKRALQDDSLAEPNAEPQRKRAVKRSTVDQIWSESAHGKPTSSADQRRLTRARRNRESAERSRQRQKLKLEGLERRVQESRHSNHLLVEDVEKVYSKLRAIKEAIDRGSGGDEKRRRAPDVFISIAMVKSAIDSCPWTFRSHEPETPLKRPDS